MFLQHTGTLCGKGRRQDAFRLQLNGIAVDAEDRLLAIGDREIKRFAPDGSLDARIATRNVGWSIAVAGKWIWVGMQAMVDRLDDTGNPLDRIEDERRLGLITGLAVTGATLIAADATHRTIHVYRDGMWHGEIGQDVNTRGFMIPNGVLDLALQYDQRTLVVAHPQKHRVERYNLEGQLTGKFGRFGMNDPADFGGCCNPTNITTTVDGMIAVSEKAPARVKLFTADGNFLAQSADGLFDANTKNIDLAADRRGRLYATDPLRCTVEVFDLGAADD